MDLSFSRAAANFMHWGQRLSPMARIVLCVMVVLAVIALLFSLHLIDRPLAAALNFFLILVLIAAVAWGARYAILVSFFAAFGFSWLIPPAGHFHLTDSRVWTLLAVCLVTGITASGLTDRVRRSQNELRDVINTVPAHVWSFLPDGTVDFVNQRWQEFTGLSIEEALAGKWESVIHPDDRAPFVAAWRAALKAPQVMERELRLRRADGEYRWWFIRNVPLRDEAGNISKWYGTGLDIEDRKRAEQELLAAMSERTRLAAFREAIGTALAHDKDLRTILHSCAEAMVRHLDAAFARIWTVSSDGRELELQASAGMYTRLDGSHSRIPVGHLKVGLIAQERKPHLTNDVQNDPRVNDEDWARREKMISFAGYPLLAGDRVMGVMAMFSQKALSESTLNTLSVVADTIAHGIDRKHAQEALQRSEAYLAESQRLSHTGSFIWDVATREALYLSDEWFRIYGFDPNDKLARSLWSVRGQRIWPEDRSRWEAAINRAIEDKSDYELEYRIDLRDGTTKHLHTLGHPVLDDSGKVVQFVGTLTDITQRKRVEEALGRSEFYLKEAQKMSHTGSWAWDSACNKGIYFSEETFRIFGLDPGRGSPPDVEEFLQLLHPEDRDTFYEHIQAAFREKADFAEEYRVLLPDGTIRHVHEIGHPVLDQAGKVIEYVGTVADVTDRKRAEEERDKLRQLEAELAHINRVTTMGELTASLGHEINQPIAAAMTNANTCVRWLTRDNPDIEEARAAAGRIVKDTQRAGEIISRIRLLFKKGAPQRELVNVNGVINEIITLLRNETARHNISIQSQLTADLPQIMGDRVQLQQVLMNLVMNSIDAMKAVEGKRELTLTSQYDGNNQLLISVSDTGIGLPPEMGRIFDAFYTTKPHGTGMGLAISRNIIESHGGHLWATANSCHGATVSFTLPATVEAQ